MEDTLLATLPLEEKEINYTVYLYIDSKVSLGKYNDKTYSGYLYASTEQTSTIGKEDNSKINLGLQSIDFDYLGDEQKFITPKTGNYQLETWGAQGGTYKNEYIGGYGGYSQGTVNLTDKEKIYLNIGGNGKSGTAVESKNYGDGGYNGGGSRSGYESGAELGSSGGGGATHIATKSGLLFSLENYKSNILIISGGGGGAGYIDDGWNSNPTNIASGGGYKGVRGQSDVLKAEDAGTQISGSSFGYGENCREVNVCDGGGGGYYGGHTGYSGASGGSGYIGNTLLTNKSMYCYNCEESTETSTKTISTTNVSENPISKYAKKGNGYARITVIN